MLLHSTEFPQVGISPGWSWDDIMASYQHTRNYFKIFTYLLGCTRSQLQHAGSLIFVVACSIFSCGMWILGCSMWDLVPWPGIELGAPELGAWSLSHWTTREVPQMDFLPSQPPGKPKNTGMGSLSLLQGNFLTQESNWGILHCRQILYQLSYPGSPIQSEVSQKEKNKYHKAYMGSSDGKESACNVRDLGSIPE